MATTILNKHEPTHQEIKTNTRYVPSYPLTTHSHSQVHIAKDTLIQITTAELN